jgi:hypothetical protein
MIKQLEYEATLLIDGLIEPMLESGLASKGESLF